MVLARRKKIELNRLQNELVRKYRHRHNLWAMEHLPSMGNEAWALYKQWVAGFRPSGNAKPVRAKRRDAARARKRGAHTPPAAKGASEHTGRVAGGLDEMVRVAIFLGEGDHSLP